MQGTSGRSHSLLLQALNNAADGSLRLALRVKIDEKTDAIHFTCWVKYFVVTNFMNLLYLFIKSTFHQFSCKIQGTNQIQRLTFPL
jgi:hypothetical protein